MPLAGLNSNSGPAALPGSNEEPVCFFPVFSSGVEGPFSDKVDTSDFSLSSFLFEAGDETVKINQKGEKNVQECIQYYH